jgi:hypothetical protein
MISSSNPYNFLFLFLLGFFGFQTTKTHNGIDTFAATLQFRKWVNERSNNWRCRKSNFEVDCNLRRKLGH